MVTRQRLILGKKIGRQFDVVKAFPRNTKAVAGDEIDAIERMIQLEAKGHSSAFFTGVDFVGLRDSNEAARESGLQSIARQRFYPGVPGRGQKNSFPADHAWNAGVPPGGN